MSMIQDFFPVSDELCALDERAREMCREQFARLDEIRDYNQMKVLKAFTDCHIGANHLVGTTGYGYDDEGRDRLDALFARVCGAEAALFRHNFMSGTHTLAVALFGVLRPGDRMVSAVGAPYDLSLIHIWGSSKRRSHPWPAFCRRNA